MTDKTQVENRSSESEKGMENRHLLRTLREGENAMRKQGTIYLPTEKEEPSEDYEYRKDYKTSLYSGTQKSIEDINNRIFSKEIIFESNNEDFQNLVLNNITGSNEGLNEFAKNWNLDAIWNGGTFAVVNFETGRVSEIEPSVLYIDIDNVLDMRVDSKGSISLFKYQVVTQEAVDLFTTEEVSYVYLYYTEGTSVKMKTFKMVDGQDEYEELADITLPNQFNEIPVVGLFPESRFKNLNPDRPYQTMAFKNKTHWIYNSIYINLVDIASRPFLLAKGFDERNKTISFGIKSMKVIKSDKASIEWIQANTDSATMMRVFLEDIKEEMKMLGSEFLESKQKAMTATEAVINSADTSSKANGFAQNLEDALIKIINFMLLWKRMPNEEFTLMVNKNISLSKDKEAFDIVNALNDKNVISDKDLRLITGSLGYLPSDLTEEEYVENLEDEGKLFNNEFITEVKPTGKEVIIEEDEE
jgi:hypothetical protein